MNKQKCSALDQLNFDEFRKLAQNQNMSKYEKIGFPDSYISSHDYDQLLQVVRG